MICEEKNIYRITQHLLIMYCYNECILFCQICLNNVHNNNHIDWVLMINQIILESKKKINNLYTHIEYSNCLP